jgi:micrococcal nuclease
MDKASMTFRFSYPGRVLFLVLFIIPALAGLSCHTIDGQEAWHYMTVTKVVDGDTFWADDGTPGGIKVRMIGLDAPESRRTGRKEIGYYGQESKDYLSAWLTGKKVRLEYDVGKYDQYHRALAYVFLEDGTFVNAELLKRGYAIVLTVPPNVKYADEFIKLQRKARRHKRGLWEESLDQTR